MERPNIFEIATKELHQDAFITWLMQFADDKYLTVDQSLNQCGKTFITQLIKKQIPNFNETINKVEAGRQWKNIDVWAEVNDKYLIIIEDKTNMSEHSDQLQRYKETSEEWCKDNNYEKPICIYLKTGNESKSRLSKVQEQGYFVFNRNDFINLFKKFENISNNIFIDFKDYLINIENRTNSFIKYEKILSDWLASEGFYMKLQEVLGDEWSDWDYVANQTGGFLGFWYHWRELDEFSIYIQIENAFDYGIKLVKLVIKVSDWEPSTDLLYKILKEIEPFAQKNGISIRKPDRFRAGETSTLAIVENAFIEDKEGNFEFDRFIDILKRLEQTLDQYHKSKS